MRELIEEIKLEESGWQQKVAAGALALGLATGVPSVSQASMHHQNHHQHGLAHKTYSEDQIIKSIVGEAISRWDGGLHKWVPNEYQNILDIACAIRNRMKNPYYKNNILYGVEGLHAKHDATESPKSYQIAKKAWEESSSRDTVNGAYIWGSPADINRNFSKQAWFKNVEPTVQRGGHTFFRDKRK